jgi:hypothetical protein
MNEQNLVHKTPKATPESRREGNKKSVKTNNLRRFWRDELLNMKEKDIQKYIDNPKNPYLNRVYAKMFLASADLDSYYKLANQIYGNPKEEIEIKGLPEISLEMFEGGDEDEDKQENC